LKNFLIGLGLGLVGFIGLFVFGILGAFSEAIDSATPAWILVAFWVSIFVLIAGPLWFWLISPIRNRLRRPSPGRT